MSSPNSSEQEIASWLNVVESKVAALRFGSVQIIVHEGRVTQVESTEKVRFASRPTNDLGSSNIAPSEKTDSEERVS
jgi:hypothetical protein